MFILQLIIILAAAKLFGHFSSLLGQPSVLGQLVSGILIGPAVLGWVDNGEFIQHLSTIGVILLMFIAGLETDMKEFQANAKASTFIGFGGIIAPLVGGYVSGLWLGLGQYESIFFGLVLTATSVSITVQCLREMGKLQSKEGLSILGAAVLDDIVVILLLAFFMTLIGGGDSSLGVVVFSKFAFFAVAILLMWKVIPYAIRKMSEMKVPQAPLAAAVILCLSFAYFAEYTGVAAIIGAYFAGISIGTTELGHSITEKTEQLGYAFFIPIFFVSIGFSAQFEGMGHHLWLLVPLSLLAIFTKLIGSGLGARLAGFNWTSSMRVGSGMVSRGEVAIILAALGLETDLLDKPMFTVLIIVILVTTLAAPPLLKLTYRERKPQTAEKR